MTERHGIGSEFSLDFIGVGAARTGTTWLARCLREHPEVFIPAREQHDFNRDGIYEPSLAGLKCQYEEASPHAVWGEFTPRYAICARALERIHTAFPRVRLIFVLRDPVERAFSQYLFFRYTKCREPSASFEVALTRRFREDYLVKSTYAPQLERLYDLFSPEQIVVLIYEEMMERPGDTIAGLYRALGVASDFRPPSLERVVNASAKGGRPAAYRVGVLRQRIRGLRRPWAAPLHSAVRGIERLAAVGAPAASLAPAQRRRIRETHFAADIARTEALLGRKLDIWTDV